MEQQLSINNESRLMSSNRGRLRPSLGYFSSNWSSSGSEGGRGRGSFFGRNTLSDNQQTMQEPEKQRTNVNKFIHTNNIDSFSSPQQLSPHSFGL